jgi:MFS family permease
MAEAPAPAAQPTWQTRFPALTYPDFRLWLLGRMGWVLGTGMRGTTMALLLYDMTQSTAALGYTTFLFGLPVMIFSLYAGVVADRVERHRLVRLTQAATILPAAVAFLLSALGMIQAWQILALSLLTGAVYAFDNPARNSFMPQLVDRADLANASVLDNVAFYTCAALAPAIAGLTYAAGGATVALALAVLFFTVPSLALAVMHVTPIVHAPRSTSALREIREGLAYIARQTNERTLFLIVASLTLFAGAVGTIIPAWSVQVLGGDAKTTGFLSAANGAGAVISSLAIASLGKFSFKGRLLTAATLALPVVLLAFSIARSIPVALGLALMGGMASLPIQAMSIVLLYTLVPETLRGRAAGVFSLTNVGLSAIGGLWIGLMAQAAGLPPTVALAGLTFGAVAALVYIYVPKLRALE